MEAKRRGRSDKAVDCRFRLPAELGRRLQVHAAVTGERPASIVAALLAAHLPRYVVQLRGGGTGTGTGTAEAGRGGADGAAA